MSGENVSKKQKLETDYPAKIVPNLTSIVQQVAASGLTGHLRDNWFSEPWMVASRHHHLTSVSLPQYVGLEDIPETMVKLFDEGDRERTAMGLLNAVSGAGKSATLQYCEEHFNNQDDDSLPLALAVTFNRSKNDLKLLDAAQGLTMRIAERFLMKQGRFHEFRELWKQNFIQNPVELPTLVQEIYHLLKRGGNKQTLLILVDEPGLSGSPRRVDDETSAESASEVVRATSYLRIRAPPRCNDKGEEEEEREDDVARYTRFVIASLKPVFSENQIQCKTVTGGPITWIAVPYVKSDEELKDLLRQHLVELKAVMPEKDFEQTIEFALAISSGHWATLVAIIQDLRAIHKKNKKPLFHFDNSKNWLNAVYFQNARDVIVQVQDVTAAHGSVTKAEGVYEDLLALAILGKKYPPFSDLFEYRATGHTPAMRNLNDFAYARIITNRIMSADGTVFDHVCPRTSLFLIRKWAIEKEKKKEVTPFHTAVLEFLQHAGHNPTRTPRAPVQTSGIAFEGVAVAFLQAKFLSWIRTFDKPVYGVPTTLPLIQDRHMLNTDRPLFPGHRRVYGTVPGFMQVPSRNGARLLRIKDKGGFCGKGDKREQYANETPEQYKEYTKAWWLEKTAKLDIEFEDEPVDQLLNGDIVCPGSKIQAHTDALTVAHFSTGEVGLIFNQFKFSAGDSTTKVQANDIISGLEKLLKERGFLFDVVDEGHGGLRNQIGKLGVKEENVVYCWSVLRPTVSLSTLRKSVGRYARSKNFKGSVVVAVCDEDNDENTSDQALSQYGDTFKDLALISSSRPPEAFEEG